MTGVFSQDDTAERFRRHIERKNRAIGTQRIGDLNKLYARRYGGREGYVFPDDDAGLEDLKILLHHYAVNNPLAIPRIIKLRAPWADAQKLQEEIDAYGPRRWKSATLGKLLRFTGAEWQVLRLRTIEPIDMTKKQRRKDSQERNRQRMRIKRRRAGKPPREEWLAENNISRTKPWEALGISRAKWYRLNKPAIPKPVRQVCSNKTYLNGEHTPVSQCKPIGSEEGGRAVPHQAAARRPSTSQSKLQGLDAAASAAANACNYEPVPAKKGAA